MNCRYSQQKAPPTLLATIKEPEVIELRCDACGALMSIGIEQRTGRCSFCDTPSVVTRPPNCLHLAQEEANASVRRSLYGFMPGDTVRSLTHQTRLIDESMDLTLVPVMALARIFASAYQ